MNNEEETVTIPSNSIIYGFYSFYFRRKTFLPVFIQSRGAYAIDDDRVITNSEDWYIDGVVYIDNSGFPSPDFARYCSFSGLVQRETIGQKRENSI